jgi:uncharacterized protein with PIN domain
VIVDTWAVIAILKEEADAVVYAQAIAGRGHPEAVSSQLPRMRNRPGFPG